MYSFSAFGYTIYISNSAFILLVFVTFYTPIYTLSMYTDLGLLFSCLGVVLGTRWENNVSSILLAPPTHTTHTYTHKYGASFSVTLGVVIHVVKCVCALAEGVHKR